jgi:hypothetical protein
MDEALGEPPTLWQWREDVRSGARFDRLCARDRTLGVRNQMEIADAEAALKIAANWVTVDAHPLPGGFLEPRLALPQTGFAPDYFSCGGCAFASRKLRDVLSQPKEVVQWAPVELVAGGAEARAQAYRWMRVLAFQPAMDMKRSQYEAEQGRDRMTGEPRLRAVWVDRYVLLEGLEARTEVFYVEETYATVLVTDGLAERVMRAGCTGVAFRDPTLPQHTGGLRRFRTATGVVVR